MCEEGARESLRGRVRVRVRVCGSRESVRVCRSARKSDDWERVMTERMTERVHVRGRVRVLAEECARESASECCV